MPTRTPLALCLCLAALIAGCGGDDEERAATTAETTPTQEAAPPPETTEDTTADTTAADSDDGPTISRADAHLAGTGPAATAADQVPNSDLYFLDTEEEVTCEAPDADQPDNLNERSGEWTCTVDSETNGVRCEGTYTVAATGADEPEVAEANIRCQPA